MVGCYSALGEFGDGTCATAVREYGEIKESLRVLDWLWVTLGEGMGEQGETI